MVPNVESCTWWTYVCNRR